MACGTQTTNQMIETLWNSDRPLTIDELCAALGKKRTTLLDGLRSVVGLEIHKVPGCKTKPKLSYTVNHTQE